MQEPQQSRILVGVAPRRGHDAALEYAAAEGARRGIDLHLVLVVHPHGPGPDGPVDGAVNGDERRDTDIQLLQCEERVAAWTDGLVAVTTEVAHGGVVPSLVAASRDAELVVLQHHLTSWPRHLPTRSITNGVATRVGAPVVAVPDGWREWSPHGQPVAAAIENAALSWPVAELALEHARRTGSAVLLTRAWSYADDLAVADPIFRTATVEAWERHLRASLAREFADLTAAYPDVSTRIDVVHGQAGYVLTQAAAQSRLLVMGRHAPSLPAGAHLGPVTRAVLAHARCPVVVVDTRRPAPSGPSSRRTTTDGPGQEGRSGPPWR